MAGTVIADNLQAAATSQLVIKNGVASTPPTIQDSAGTTIGTFCRAWVNFNGTGTVAIRASFNVSSITDNGTGDYTVNFTNALTDANYGFNLNATRSTLGVTDTISYLRDTPTTSLFRINTTSGSGTLVDSLYTTVSVFR